MPGLDPGIHAFHAGSKDVDGRDKPGHDVRVQLDWTIYGFIAPCALV